MTDAIVHFLVGSGHGGDALSALALAGQQRAFGYDARIVMETTPHVPTFLGRARAAGVPVDVVGVSYEKPRLARRLLSLPLRVAALGSSVAAHAPRVIHCHSPVNKLDPEEVMAVGLARADVALVKCCASFDYIDGATRARMVWRKSSRVFDRVMCATGLAKQIQLRYGLPERRLAVLPNGVDVEAIRKGDRARARGELGLGPDDVAVLFLSRMDREKRPLDALMAFHENAARFPQARMVFVGSGTEEERCARYAVEHGLTPRVTFAGYRTDVADLVRAGDIYVLPTEGESFGNTLVEAMAAGMPIVTTDVWPVAYDVVPRDCGLFSAVGDVAALAAGIARLAGDPGLRDRMGRAASAAADRFHLGHVARRFLALYDEILEEKRKPRLQTVGSRAA